MVSRLPNKPDRLDPQRLPSFSEPAAVDILSDATEFEEDARGLRAVRKCLVEDITGSGPRVLVNALYAPNIPRMGEAFPKIDTLWVTRRTVKMVESCTTKAWVWIYYGHEVDTFGFFDNEPGDHVTPYFEIDNTVVFKRTNKDISGNPIRITGYRDFVYNEDGTPQNQLSDHVEPPQGGFVDVAVTTSVFRYRRRELPMDSRHRGLWLKARHFCGTVNDDIIFTNDGPRTWMVTGLNAVSDDGMKTFNVTYTLTHAGIGPTGDDTWDAVVAYVDPETGQIGAAVGGIPGDSNTANNGIVIAQVARETNFETMDIFI